jgi:hypothetical protein
MSIPTVESRRFMVGKYEVVARPIPHSAHMLRYTVMLDGKRLGALASFPTESDCLFLEKPPVVPPLKIYSVIYRPGRPKGGSKPAVAVVDKAAPPREDLSQEISLPAGGGEDR